MKVFRGIIGFLLIVIIISGVGYLVWSFTNMSAGIHGMKIPGSSSSTEDSAHGAQNKNDSAASTPEMLNLNTQILQSKDKLNQVVTAINDAVNQITIDPYSKVTVPGTNNSMNTQQNGQGQQGGTTVNIYPNSNNAVNPPQAGAAGTNGTMSGNNVVYDQGKLEQMHNGIFKLAQGVMLLNELNDDLTIQSTSSESTDYSNLTARYNMLQADRVKLSRSLNLINEASILINVNPYTSSNGYAYNTQAMEQLHRGIYRLAQGMLSGTRLGEDFTKQMASINSFVNNNSMSNMNGVNIDSSLFIGSMNISTIVSILLIVFIVVFLIALFGAIRSMFKSVVANK